MKYYPHRIVRINFEEFVLILLSIGILLPAFKAFTRIPAFYPALGLFIVYTLLFFKEIYLRRTILWVYLLFVLVLVYYLSEYYSFFYSLGIELINKVLAFLVPSIFIEFLLLRDDPKQNQRLGRIALILIIITAGLGLLSEIVFPGITRFFNRNISDYPGWMVPASYSFIYMLPYLAAVILNLHKKSLTKRLLMTILIIVLIIKAGFFIAVGLTLVMIVAALLLRSNMNKKLLIALIIFGAIIINSLGIKTLQILKIIPNNVIIEKIEGLEQRAKPGSNSLVLEAREAAYKKSWNNFNENVFFGTGSYKSAGGHSYWLDKLAHFGIIGTIPYLLILVVLFRRAKLLIPPQGISIYNMAFMVVLIMLIFNPYESLEYWTIIFCFLPLIICYLVNSNETLEQKH